jgi:hypothetical protein
LLFDSSTEFVDEGTAGYATLMKKLEAFILDIKLEMDAYQLDRPGSRAAGIKVELAEDSITTTGTGNTDDGGVKNTEITGARNSQCTPPSAQSTNRKRRHDNTNSSSDDNNKTCLRSRGVKTTGIATTTT